MKLRRLKSLGELGLFTPSLIALHSTLHGKWEPELSADDFIIELFNRYDETSYFYGDFIDGELAYFAALYPQSSTKALFWIFYVNPKHWVETKEILTELKTLMKNEGFDTVYTQSTRTASSYERWLKKFGAEKVAIVYKFKL